jgi:allantoin racemase
MSTSIRIKVIVPVTFPGWDDDVKRVCRSAADSATRIEVMHLARGPASIESMFDEEWAALPILQAVAGAEQDYDAAIIYCFGNPALEAAKEAVSIPVVGLGEAAQVAAMPLGDRLGVLATLSSTTTRHWRKARALGTAAKLVSVRALDIPVLDLVDRGRVRERAQAVVQQMVMEDGIDVLILGCGSMVDLGPELELTFDLPVVVPALAAVKLAELYVRAGLTQSKRAYPLPGKKERTDTDGLG